MKDNYEFLEINSEIIKLERKAAGSTSQCLYEPSYLNSYSLIPTLQVC